jgi:hypothetical protein
MTSPQIPLQSIAFFPQKASLMHDSKSVLRITLCSENRTELKSNLPHVINRDIKSAPPSGPRLSYSPVGLENKVSESVCEYLAWCEANEPNVWLRDDIRIAWLTVLNASEGKPDPWRYSFWMYLGRVPEKVIPELVARAERHRLMEVPDYDPTVKMAQSPAASQKRKEIA